MDRLFTLYLDDLKKVLAHVEANIQKTPLAEHAITMVVSDNDNCLKLFQEIGHDWIYLNEVNFCEYK